MDTNSTAIFAQRVRRGQSGTLLSSVSSVALPLPASLPRCTARVPLLASSLSSFR